MEKCDSATEGEVQERSVHLSDELSREEHTSCQHDCVSDQPGRIWGPSEVVNAWQASVLRQNGHYAGCGKERLGVYTDTTGFVP